MITLGIHPNAHKLDAIEKACKKIHNVIMTGLKTNQDYYRTSDYPRAKINKAAALYYKMGEQYHALLYPNGAAK